MCSESFQVVNGGLKTIEIDVVRVQNDRWSQMADHQI